LIDCTLRIRRAYSFIEGNDVRLGTRCCGLGCLDVLAWQVSVIRGSPVAEIRLATDCDAGAMGRNIQLGRVRLDVERDLPRSLDPVWDAPCQRNLRPGSFGPRKRPPPLPIRLTPDVRLDLEPAAGADGSVGASLRFVDRKRGSPCASSLVRCGGAGNF
jgi:hypothetical protein